MYVSTGCEGIGIAVAGGCDGLGLFSAADVTYKFLCAINGASGLGANSKRLPSMGNVLDDDQAYGTVSAMHTTVRRISIVEGVTKCRDRLALYSATVGAGIDAATLLGAGGSGHGGIAPGVVARKQCIATGTGLNVYVTAGCTGRGWLVSEG